MAEQPIDVDWAVENDCDVTLTVTMSVYHGTDLDRFIHYLKGELGTLAHDTFKQHWNENPT